MLLYRYANLFLFLVNITLTAYVYKLYIGLSAVVFYQSVILKEIMINYDQFFQGLQSVGPLMNFYYYARSVLFFREHKIHPISNWRFQDSVEKFSGTGIKNEWLLSLDDLLSNSGLIFFEQHKIFKNFYIKLEELFLSFGIDANPWTLLFFISFFIFCISMAILLRTDSNSSIISDHRIRLYQLELFIAEKLNEGRPILHNKPTKWSPIKELFYKFEFDDYNTDHLVTAWLNELKENEKRKKENVAGYYGNDFDVINKDKNK